MRMQLTFKAGAQVVVDIDEMPERQAGGIDGSIGGLMWSTPDGWLAALVDVSVPDLAAVVVLRDPPPGPDWRGAWEELSRTLPPSQTAGLAVAYGMSDDPDADLLDVIAKRHGVGVECSELCGAEVDPAVFGGRPQDPCRKPKGHEDGPETDWKRDYHSNGLLKWPVKFSNHTE